MSMLLRLDTPAVRRLIEDDPAFKLELTRACVAEIVRQLVLKDAGKVLELIEPAVHKAILAEHAEHDYFRKALGEALSKLVENKGDWARSNWQPTGEAKKRIEAALKPTVEQYLQSFAEGANAKIAELSRTAITTLDEAAEKLKKTIDDRLEARLNNRLDQYIDAEVNRRLKEKFSAALIAAGAE